MPRDHWTLVVAARRGFIAVVRPLGRLAPFQRASMAYTHLVHTSDTRSSLLRVKLESDTGSRIIGTFSRQSLEIHFSMTTALFTKRAWQHAHLDALYGLAASAVLHR